MAGRRSKNSPQKAKGLATEAEALELRKAGATYRQIGERIGITEEGARKAVLRAMEKLAAVSTETADELRAIEVERLDAMLLGLWPRARKGDEKAVTAAIRLMERRSKLLGLDKPSRHEVSGIDGEPLYQDRGAEIIAALERLADSD